MKKLLLSFATMAAGASSFALTYTGSGFTTNDWNNIGGGVLQTFGTTTVSGTGLTIASVDSVTITGFTHSNAGDIDAFLINNTTNVFIDLFSPPDATTANFNGDYTFKVDSSLSTVDQTFVGKSTSYNLPSGTYAASEYGDGTNPGDRADWSALSGTALDGDWFLVVDDYVGPSVNGGKMTSFSFNVTAQPVPEPSTMVALGLGAVAVLRRRRKA